MADQLSSDALERHFGPTKLEASRQDTQGRIIATKVVKTGKVLELSRVAFRPEGTAAFPDVHHEILQGISIGKAFAAAAVRFKRDVRISCRYDREGLPDVFAKRFDTQEPPTVTIVSILVGPDELPYADILEVYSPDVVPWELTGTGPDRSVAARLKVFGDELAALPHNP